MMFSNPMYPHQKKKAKVSKGENDTEAEENSSHTKGNFQLPQKVSCLPIDIERLNGFQELSLPPWTEEHIAVDVCHSPGSINKGIDTVTGSASDAGVGSGAVSLGNRGQVHSILTTKEAQKPVHKRNGTEKNTANQEFESSNSANPARPKRCFEEAAKPFNLIFSLQARGELLAQPLIPHQDFENFFHGLQKGLELQGKWGNPPDVTLVKQQVTRAIFWVTYPFLGIVQLKYEYSGPIQGKKGLLSLQAAVIEAWEFLKQILTHWQTFQNREANNSVMQPVEASQCMICLDSTNILEELKSYMHTEWEDKKNPPDSHLWHLFERWSIVHTRDSTEGWYSTRYREVFDKLHMENPLSYLNPCLQNHEPASDPHYRKLYKRLQSRGEFIIESLRLTEQLDLVSDEAERSLTSPSGSSDLLLIKKAFTRIRSWTAFRFIGAVQVIFVHNRIHRKKTRVSTLQQEISDGLSFLKDHFEGFKNVALDHWIFSRPRAFNVKLIDWSDHAQVFGHYMHHPSHNYPTPGHFLHLLYIWLSHDNTSEFSEQAVSHLSKFLLEKETFVSSLGILESNPAVRLLTNTLKSHAVRAS